MSFGEAFLTVPDLFPARQSGESWGDRTLALELPGGDYLASGLAAAQCEALEQRFGAAARAPRGGEPASLRVLRAAPGDFQAVETRGWNYALDTAHHERSIEIAGLHLMARLDWSPEPRACLWTDRTAGGEFVQAFENVLRLYAAYRIFELGGLMVHGAAALDGEAAHLFLGCSGAGKSTVARLSLESGREVLSDDLNALLREDDAFVLRGLPFTGDLDPAAIRPGSFAMRRFYRLVQHRQHALDELPTTERVALLAACAPFLNADPHRSEALLERAAEIARRIPAAELRFKKDADFWTLLAPK
jgi:hypothetical protein